MSAKKIIIAIDGYSACGKSTLAQNLADALGYIYITTGAMYRAVTLYFLRHDVDWNDEAQVIAAMKNIHLEFKNEGNGNRMFMNGEDVEDEIREPHVSGKVSDVAAISHIRKVVVEQQREMGKQKGIVMDGRDIGTVVFPEAELKIFMTADVEVRTLRRLEEMKAKGIQISKKEVEENLRQRDHIDSTRKDSPLKKAPDAIILDNTHLSREEQLQLAIQYSNSSILQ